jgi:hypothetical protein
MSFPIVSLLFTAKARIKASEQWRYKHMRTENSKVNITQTKLENDSLAANTDDTRRALTVLLSEL